MRLHTFEKIKLEKKRYMVIKRGMQYIFVFVTHVIVIWMYFLFAYVLCYNMTLGSFPSIDYNSHSFSNVHASSEENQILLLFLNFQLYQS